MEWRRDGEKRVEDVRRGLGKKVEDKESEVVLDMNLIFWWIARQKRDSQMWFRWIDVEGK